MSNNLNKYFISGFGQTADVFPHVPEPTNIQIKVTQKGVFDLIKNLKDGKAPGPDGFRKEDLMLDLVLAKAFDKVPHGRLARKLLDSRLDSCYVRWIQGFLSERASGFSASTRARASTG